MKKKETITPYTCMAEFKKVDDCIDCGHCKEPRNIQAQIREEFEREHFFRELLSEK